VAHREPQLAYTYRRDYRGEVWSLSKLSSSRSRSSLSVVTYGDATLDDNVCVISLVSSNICNEP